MSGVSRLRGIVAARSLRGRIRVAGRASFGRGVRVGSGVRIDVARGATLRVGRGCRLGAGCRLTVCGGAVELGAGSVVGESCTLIGRLEIVVGERARLGEGVTILDFGPAPTDSERPARVQPLHAAAVVVGADSLVGPRAALGPGVRVAASGRVEAGVVLGGLAEPLLAACEAPAARSGSGLVGVPGGPGSAGMREGPGPPGVRADTGPPGVRADTGPVGVREGTETRTGPVGSSPAVDEPVESDEVGE